MSSWYSLGVLWESEAQIYDGQASKLFPQIEHLRVSVILELHTLGDLHAGPAIGGQAQTLAAIAVTHVAALRVHTLTLTDALLTLIHIWINKGISTHMSKYMHTHVKIHAHTF